MHSRVALRYISRQSCLIIIYRPYQLRLCIIAYETNRLGGPQKFGGLALLVYRHTPHTETITDCSAPLKLEP